VGAQRRILIQRVPVRLVLVGPTTRKIGKPLEQLVAQEAQLASAGEAMTGHPPLPDHLPEVLDVYLEELGGERGSQDRWELLRRSHRREHPASVRCVSGFAKRMTTHPT
jgi:hypothetical protein